MKLSIRHIAKIFLFVLIFAGTGLSQSDSTNAITKFTSDTTFVMHKSPLGAVLRSAVIPGWGQLYNHSYIKAPIIWGLTGWLTYLWIWNNKSYHDAVNSYNATQNSEYIRIKNFYQDQRDLVAIYMGLTYVLNLIDAYVDAELYDFSFKEDAVTNSPMLNIRIKF